MPHQLSRDRTRHGPLLPGLVVLRNYERAWLRGDLLGGITVAAYLVPQVMAYAAIAGLPPVTGLWAALAPLAVYALLGSSRRLSVGPESSTALMSAAGLGAVAAGDPETYAAAAALLAILVGVVCLLARVVRLGFVADLLSRPVLIGYLAGIAVLMIVGQLGRMTGLPVQGDRPLAKVAFLLSHLDAVAVPTLTMALVITGSLLIAQRLRPHWPHPMAVMLLAAAVTSLWGLDAHGISTVGTIPAGLPVPRLPGAGVLDPQVLMQLALPAVGIAVVGYTGNVLTARAFGARHHEHVDADQELFSLGAANLAAGLTQGFPVSSSASRTVIGESLGVRTQLHSLVAIGAVLVTIVALRPVLGAFPEAALAGVVTYAAIRLVDVAELRRIAHFRSSELILALATTIGVLLLGILPGIGVAVGLSILDLLRRVARGHDGVLGFVPNLAGMHDIDDHPNTTTVAGLVVYRYDSPLFFANAEDFRLRALAAVEDGAQEDRPTEWLLVNMESNLEVDLTALDALEDLRSDLVSRGVVLALARVKHELRLDLDRIGLTDKIRPDHIYPTLPVAVAAYATEYVARHGERPSGAP